MYAILPVESQPYCNEESIALVTWSLLTRITDKENQVMNEKWKPTQEENDDDCY